MNSDMKSRAYYALGSFHGSIGNLKRATGYLEMARDLRELRDAPAPGDDSNCTPVTTVRTVAEIEGKLNGDEVKRELCLLEEPSKADSKFGDIESWFNSMTI